MESLVGSRQGSVLDIVVPPTQPRSRAGSFAGSFVYDEEGIQESVLGKLHRRGTVELAVTGMEDDMEGGEDSEGKQGQLEGGGARAGPGASEEDGDPSLRFDAEPEEELLDDDDEYLEKMGAWGAQCKQRGIARRLRRVHGEEDGGTSTMLSRGVGQEQRAIRAVLAQRHIAEHTPSLDFFWTRLGDAAAAERRRECIKEEYRLRDSLPDFEALGARVLHRDQHHQHRKERGRQGASVGEARAARAEARLEPQEI